MLDLKPTIDHFILTGLGYLDIVTNSNSQVVSDDYQHLSLLEEGLDKNQWLSVCPFRGGYKETCSTQ